MSTEGLSLREMLEGNRRDDLLIFLLSIL